MTRLIRGRFGDQTASRSAELLEGISDPLALEDLGEQLLDSAGPEAWLAALEQAARLATQVGEEPEPVAPSTAPPSH